MPQALRRSQFITTYGPGAILEGKQGPRVIPALCSSGLFKTRQISNFEITDSRLSKALLGDAGIVRLPSNAELGLPDSTEIYDTSSFPAWALCTRHQVLYHKLSGVGNSRQACPRCQLHSSDREAWQQVHRQAIRFVQVCLKGHLDDVNWVRIVKHLKQSCQPDYLYWRGAGSALRNITIVCPDCNGSVNLGLAYSQPLTCSGRFPERGAARSSCDAEAKMIQRGASNLRMPELYSSLTIPPSDTRLNRLLETSAIRGALALSSISTKQDLMNVLRILAGVRTVGPALIAEVDRYNEQEILVVVNQMKAPLPESNRELRQQEFEALQRAATAGAPPQSSSTPGAPPQFEVIRTDVREFPGPNGRRLRITPVSRLRVVMVQKGYRRLDPLKGEVVECVYVDDQDNHWYPGTELYGEGLFVDLAPDSCVGGYHFPLNQDRTWLSAWRDPLRYRQRIQVPSDEQDYLHPVFVWWHTLAHRLINALSIDSGYSSAAIRERIYIDIDEISGEASGGILLYTAQPGGDGTLGGMIALVPRFDRVLRVAFNTIDGCSNDPLCSEVQFTVGKYNGAACYACQLVSETSCEHRNTRLDRNLLKENLP
ncbi:MAG TPA: DUF1998 domain-containing protein [Ktedonobacteraceae bacterium]|nr:DUF1998 domain-containing protein [Ktedonobacteraceae bacterium]